MSPRVGVVVFPGTNCEFDVVAAVRTVGGEAETVWHRATSVEGFDAIVLPGGFAHGDYLRTGALARFSPVMTAIERFAVSGGPVLGICNGFQVLCEAGLLPGALRRNAGMRFLCQPVELEVVSTTTVATTAFDEGQRLTIPINHFDGNFTCEESTLRRLVDGGQIVMRYVDNPNGAMGDAAAVTNERGNVVGMMPHPERASHPLLGATDGLGVFASLLSAAQVRS